MGTSERPPTPGRLRIVVTDAPDPADVDRLEARVHEATVVATGRDDIEPLAVLVHDDDDVGAGDLDGRGSLVGGISGSTWGGTCELEYLWVDPDHRGRGLGRQLLVAAEREARRRGCHQVVLFTHEIEAPGLYDRLGYELVGRVDDYPTGGAASWYRKPLREVEAQSD